MLTEVFHKNLTTVLLKQENLFRSNEHRQFHKTGKNVKSARQ